MDGIIIVDKPKGCTSHDVVYKIRKIFNEKVGHTGTLDPLATGVLPILIGKGTGCAKYLVNHDKTYIVQLQLGKKTDTADSEGRIIEEKDVIEDNFNEENVIKILDSFLGKQSQIPPIYSAIKVKGKKLYEYAREGKKVDILPRQIEIFNIKLINLNFKYKQIEFSVECSKGTYVRSLCEDIAEKLKTVGYMSNLRRIKVGNFTIDDAIILDDIERSKDKNISKVITIEKLFKDEKNIYLNNRKIELLLNGVQLSNNNNDGIYKIYNEQEENKFVGIGIVKKQLLKRDIIVI